MQKQVSAVVAVFALFFLVGLTGGARSSAPFGEAGALAPAGGVGGAQLDARVHGAPAELPGAVQEAGEDRLEDEALAPWREDCPVLSAPQP